MKTILPILFAAVLVAGCNGPEESLPPVTPPPSGTDQTTPPENPPKPARFSPEEWANHPIFKKPNPYDMPMEYEIEVPELPPQGVMEPGPELPPADDGS
jgi:hypothetical protein